MLSNWMQSDRLMMTMIGIVQRKHSQQRLSQHSIANKMHANTKLMMGIMGCGGMPFSFCHVVEWFLHGSLGTEFILG